MNCLKCQISWNDPQNNYKSNECPFCKAELPKKSDEETIIHSIVHTYAVEIYKDQNAFSSVISKYFTKDEDFARLLKIIVKNGGAEAIYKIREKTKSEIEEESKAIIKEVAQKTFIPKDLVKRAIEVLCFGVIKEDDEIAKQNTSNWKSSPEADFKIEKGVLIEYLGTGGDVIIPATVTVIGRSAFERHHITSILIPNTVTKIEHEAFGNCSDLEKVTLSENIEIIEDVVFINCINLKEINIPESLKYIGEQTFYACRSLSEISIPSIQMSIGFEAFFECHQLKEETIAMIKKVNPVAIW